MADRNPYEGLAPQAYWRSGLATHPLNPGGLYRKSFDIGQTDRIATAGSCFAQHIARALRGVGLNVLDTEPAPKGLPASCHQDFGYALYSARFANIYTARQLLQLLQEAFEGRVSPEPVWEKQGRHYDSMRPSVEPEGLACAEDVRDHRAYHLARVREMVAQTDVFIFTLGLTECWEHRATGWVFPTAPGTIAGSFDPDKHAFRNLTYPEILADLEQAMALIARHSTSDKLRFLFTVSPVPLTATYSGQHVQVATSHSKAVLRAVVGQIIETHANAAYFPSYEIVTSPLSRGAFYEANMRSVNKGGVRIIMEAFLAEHGLSERKPDLPQTDPKDSPALPAPEEDVVCEEALLDAFSPRKG